jgi:hypothetical protein
MLRKNEKQVFTRVLIMVTIVALALTLSLSAGGPKDKVKVFGKTYGEWSAVWWQWIAAIPAAENPLFDEEEEVDLSIGQEGKAWFLAGSWVGPIVHTGEVPAGKALFFPVFNLVAYNDPELGETYTEEELRGMATWFINLVTAVSCTVDGEACEISSIPRPKAIVRVQSPVFGFSGDLLGSGSSDFAVSDGYWVMLPPLSEGVHEIHFHAEVPDFEIVQDVTYNITVVEED